MGAVEFNDPQWGSPHRMGAGEADSDRVLSCSRWTSRFATSRLLPSRRLHGEHRRQVPASNAGSSLHPQVRSGFWFNIGMGYGTLGCDGCSRVTRA